MTDFGMDNEDDPEASDEEEPEASDEEEPEAYAGHQPGRGDGEAPAEEPKAQGSIDLLPGEVVVPVSPHNTHVFWFCALACLVTQVVTTTNTLCRVLDWRPSLTPWRRTESCRGTCGESWIRCAIALAGCMHGMNCMT